MERHFSVYSLAHRVSVLVCDCQA